MQESLSLQPAMKSTVAHNKASVLSVLRIEVIILKIGIPGLLSGRSILEEGRRKSEEEGGRREEEEEWAESGNNRLFVADY